MSVNTDASDRPQVLKFGGSSLGRAARLGRVLEIVARERSAGPLAVVVSAMGDTTDDLLAAFAAAVRGERGQASALVERIASVALASAGGALSARGVETRDLQQRDLEALIAGELAPLRALLEQVASSRDDSLKTRDRVLAFGELLSSALVAACLRAVGVPAERVDARTWVSTDARHGDASVRMAETRARAATLADGWLGDGQPISVHTGFLGATSDRETTTLGRNGSDYSAAILAAVLDARGVTVWTDVPGVMTADPALVPEAYSVPNLSYREALELAGLGLRMFHPRTMQPLMEANIPLRIRDTMNADAPGTLVDRDGSTDARRPTCIASLDDMALLDLEGTLRSRDARLAPRALTALAAAGVDVWLSATAPVGNGIAIVVRDEASFAAKDALDAEFAAERACGEANGTRIAHGVAVVTLVAEAMGRTANVAGRFFAAIGAVGVNVRAASQGATSRAISCVVDAADTAAAVQAVHAVMNLATERVSVLVLGKGTVGAQFLAQMGDGREALSRRHDVDLRLVGVADSRASWFDEASSEPHRALERLQVSDANDDVLALLDRLKRLPLPVLVDCTASSGMERVYEAAFGRGVHVVTANKKTLALPTPERDALFAAARRAHRAFRYETTVGASLPVIETLQNLVRTGDRVRLIEGSLSGTLGYLSNEVSRGVRLSVAVRAARSLGYTEPHPRDDLSGVDAARKALILARELGLSLELEDVEVEPFVPAEFFAHDSVDAFFDALATYDDAFEARIEALRREGKVLRYLVSVAAPDAATPGAKARVRVGPIGVAEAHPAARLRGTEAFVAFHTERYSDYPLVVQGAGAGGAVTAAGVLADVLAISRARRGR